MKKRLLCTLMIASIAFTGCQNSSNELLAYKDTAVAKGQSVDNRITQADYFAKNITVVTKEDNVGGDQQLTSGATLLIDVTDNKVIYADHAFDKMYPASLTKLLTALVVFKYGEMTDSVTVSENAFKIADIGAKVCGYKEGDVLTLDTLLNSLLIYSGNDAAIAIAEHVGGSEEAFVTMMNKEAQSIGAVQSNFMNSHGLHDDNQFTTVYDMYLIMNELLTYDTFRSIISKNTYTSEYKNKDGNDQEKAFDSTNSYLNGDAEPVSGISITGGLSGATNKAGNCLILLCKDSKGKEYISLILNASDSDTLYSQMNHLLSMAGAE
ncbi:MAG TPA: serine hydrolase [Mobilitalea sp.]|nr:serine hydrolase [Mobilitalea sp.]